MGILLELVNFDRMLAESSIQPIIVNDLSTATEEEKEFHDRIISTKYVETDLFSNEPSCECGYYRSTYNLGMKCPKCHTPVRDIFEQQLKPIIWMRSPVGVQKLMNPVMWNMLNNKFTKNGGFSFIEWICNTDYQPSILKPIEIQILTEMGVKRGYNNFVENFDDIISKLFELRSFKNKSVKDKALLDMITKYRDCIFSEYVPLPNKSLLIVEESVGETYIDPIIVGAIDAIRTISSIDSPLSQLTVRQKENRTCKTIAKLSSFYYNIYHDVLAAKTGWFRKHNFGTRNHFSSRAVISSNTKQHAYDEIYISWGLGCTMLKLHIMNKLLKMNYTPNDATAFIHYCTTTYDPLMDRIFKELIDESPDKGLWCFFNRNPSLTRSSVQRMKITKVKTDVTDPTITLSILSVVGYNADKLFILIKSPCIEEKGVIIN